MKTNGFQRIYDIVETDTGLKRLADSYYQRFLSQNAKERKPSAIRSLFPLEHTPGVISLLAGKPNPTTFPITSLSFSACSPTSSSPTEEQSYTLGPEELAVGLQYCATAGIQPLKEWLYGLQERSHGRKKGEGWSVFVGMGSRDPIYKAVQVLVDDGDPVFIESPIYAGIIPMFQNLHCEQIEIGTDAGGISASSLRSILENWPTDKKRPKVLYTIPNGCTPTGATATLERRKEILKLAREYDFIILEDDPDFYLYYGTAPRIPSYFSLEKDELPEIGRVLRFDSFSKTLSAGIRVGFASGPEKILDAIDKHSATANSQTSSLTQVIVNKLLQAWGYDGFKSHTERVAMFYGEKRDIFQKAMKKYLEGYAEWVAPEAGMYFWFKLKFPNTNEAAGEGNSGPVIRGREFDKGVLALPGKVFLLNGTKATYVRASFGINSEEEVYEALKALRFALVSAGDEL